jgi:hypothetical protein
MKETTIQSTVTPHVLIVIQKPDSTEETWKMCLDYRAIAKFESETGLDVKRPDTWEQITSGETFAKLVWCCLTRYSPHITFDDVLDNLNPAAHQYLRAALLELTFPGFLERAAQRITEQGASPNGQPDSQTKTT